MLFIIRRYSLCSVVNFFYCRMSINNYICHIFNVVIMYIFSTFIYCIRNYLLWCTYILFKIILYIYTIIKIMQIKTNIYKNNMSFKIQEYKFFLLKVKLFLSLVILYYSTTNTIILIRYT